MTTFDSPGPRRSGGGSPVPGPGPVRVGLVGLGSIGTTHARAIRELGDRAVVVAVSGGTPESRSRECPDAVARTPQQVIADDDVEVVVIATPAGSHADLALAAIRAGRDVVIEKPLAVRLADAERLVAAADRAGVVVAVMAQRRFEPLHRELATLLHQGRLGRVVLGEVFVHWSRDDAYYFGGPAWRRESGQGAGSLPNQGLHSLDALLFLLGPVTTVTAQQATLGHDLPFEDTTVATLRFASGALGVAVTTTAAPPGRAAELALFTDRGSLVVEHDRIARWDVAGVEPPVVDPAGAGSGFADPTAIGVAGHRAQWLDILDARRDGRPPQASGAEGLATLRVIDAIERAALTGRSTPLTPHPG